MENKQLEVYRKALISLREETAQLITDSEEATGTVTLDQSKVGRLSRMDALQAQQMAQETARRRQVQLQKIDNAVGRIEANDYGHCFKCGEEIAAARLNFDPTSTRCVGCMDT